MKESDIPVEKALGDEHKEPVTGFIPGLYSKVEMVLSEEDLKTPVVQKHLITEVERLKNAIAELKVYERNFYIVDKEKAVLEEKLKSSNSFEILYSFCLTIGAAFIGLSTIFYSDTKYSNYFFVLIASGFFLIIGAAISKIKR